MRVLRVSWSSELRPRLAMRVVCVMACVIWSATDQRLLAADEGGARRALLVGIDRYTIGEQ